MKRIAVRGLLPPDMTSAYSKRRMHSVHLGNAQRVHFNSLREARAFQAATNRMLNEVLHELNYLLGVAWMDYRTAWPLMFVNGAPVGTVERDVRAQLTDAEAMLQRAITNSIGANGMHWAWKFLGHGASYLAACFTHLATFHRSRYRFELAQRCAMHTRACAACATRLSAYGLPM